MTRSLFEHACAWRTDEVSAVVVEVVATRGSAPREAGTRMLVAADAIAGTVGGGRLEWHAIATARAMLSDEALRPPDETLALGASLGQCCGGAVTLRWRMLDAASLAAWPRASARPVVQVHGAGHVGRALVPLVATLDVRVQWIDERADAFPIEPSPANVERIAVDAVDAEVGTAPPGSLYVVMTHQHDLDLAIVAAVLRRADFAWLGVIGSATKRRRFEQLLRARGVVDDALARMTCPIGIDGIDGKEPAHIAIAVAAQVLPVVERERARASHAPPARARS